MSNAANTIEIHGVTLKDEEVRAIGTQVAIDLCNAFGRRIGRKVTKREATAIFAKVSAQMGPAVFSLISE